MWPEGGGDQNMEQGKGMDGWMDGNLGLVMGPTALALQTAPNTHASFVDFYQNGKAQIPSGQTMWTPTLVGAADIALE